jgi:hypothetical protein
MSKCVLQDWVLELPFMQQSVLISSIRGADGVIKDHPSKNLMRWLRRCVLLSAFDKRVLDNPYEEGGGSYTGPSYLTEKKLTDDPLYKWEDMMDVVVKDFMKSQDSLPLHFYLHVIHASSILGYHHSNERIRNWWNKTYNRLCHDMHLHPETQEELDNRLNDNEKAWRADESRFKK